MTGQPWVPPAAGGAPRTPVIGVVGNPNCGKSTLFNALTGRRQKVANFPGVTVERVEGTYVHDGTTVSVLDLPGTYSLSPKSPDEKVAVDVLQGRMPGMRGPDRVVIVIDATNLERNLYLASQALALGIPAVVALTEQVARLFAAANAQVASAIQAAQGGPNARSSAPTGQAGSASAAAASGNGPDDVGELRRRVAALEARIAELEARLAGK